MVWIQQTEKKVSLHKPNDVACSLLPRRRPTLKTTSRSRSTSRTTETVPAYVVGRARGLYPAVQYEANPRNGAEQNRAPRHAVHHPAASPSSHSISSIISSTHTITTSTPHHTRANGSNVPTHKAATPQARAGSVSKGDPGGLRARRYTPRGSQDDGPERPAQFHFNLWRGDAFFGAAFFVFGTAWLPCRLALPYFALICFGVGVGYEGMR
ncbi:uncharacterized protein K452DRAFT_162003 [Aplosporella prunicola CBS 121167]|uniref:Uncharacterized protein n=1 Tax=Aplosporella prunicola CBS 121167 TaxID=1176127 RepID=A0A6A6BIF1_9PEZI|nr:uncharacterized protein K452DRAFT_162003 [Aplosporella prunicola CBS 121167]KAF2143776.1 hypothetical protein K452DRAFT_162003 [Aplosporella prunicola CBS 121167]